MCKKEIEKYDAQIKAYGKKVSASQKKSEAFLISIGVTNTNGEISKHYKKLCTQQGQV